MIKVYRFAIKRTTGKYDMVIRSSSISTFKSTEELVDSLKETGISIFTKLSENTSISFCSNQSSLDVLLIVSENAMNEFDKLFVKYYMVIDKLVFDIAKKLINSSHIVKISDKEEMYVYAESLRTSVESILKWINTIGTWTQMADVGRDVSEFKDFLDSINGLKQKPDDYNESDICGWPKATIPQPMFSNNDGSHRFGEYNIPSVAPHLIKISESNNSKAVKVFKFNTDCVDEFEASINQYISSRKVVSINTEVVNNIIIVIVLTEEEQNENRSRNTLH